MIYQVANGWMIMIHPLNHLKDILQNPMKKKEIHHNQVERKKNDLQKRNVILKKTTLSKKRINPTSEKRALRAEESN